MVTFSSCLIFFYPFAEWMWLCIRLNNAGKYCDITLKIIIMLQNVGRREASYAAYVHYLVKKVKETGILMDKPKRLKPKWVRTPANIAAVAESVCEAPSTLIHRRSQKLNISETSLRRILHKVLSTMPYKDQLVQELKSIDHHNVFSLS